jgi:hypothetical protein
MALDTRLAVLFCLWSALGIPVSWAASWPGVLVDAKCYQAEQRNVNPTDTLTNVDRDGNLELRYCSPGAKTKSYAIVQQDGTSFNLDAAGNAEAAGLVRKRGQKSLMEVAVTGEKRKATIQVDSISPAK